MSASDLPPLPSGFASRNPPEIVRHDVQALSRLGYLAAGACISDAADPMFREAVLAFQLARGLAPDGAIGPQTRGELGRLTMGILAPVARLSARLPDEFFRLIGAKIRAWREKGATVTGSQFLAVLNAESGINPARPNAQGSFCFGLNQLCTFEDRKHAPGVFPGFRKVGFAGSPAEWMALSPVAQLPFVFRYFENAVANHGGVAKLRDGTSLYLANLAPGHMAHADNPDHKIYLDPSPEFRMNAGIDADGDKAIEVRELAGFLERGKAANRDFWNEVEARYAVLGDEPPQGGGLAGALVAIGIVGVIGASAWECFT